MKSLNQEDEETSCPSICSRWLCQASLCQNDSQTFEFVVFRFVGIMLSLEMSHWNHVPCVSCSHEDLWEQIKEDAEADWKAMKESLSDGMENMEKEVKEDWDVVKDTAKEDWKMMKDTAKEDWKMVKEEAQDDWNKLDLDWNKLAPSKVLPAESAESEENESKGKEREILKVLSYQTFIP